MKFLALILVLLLAGCAASNDGGGAGYISVDEFRKMSPQGEVLEDHTTWGVKLQQPDNPEKAGTVTVASDEAGRPVISLNTGNSFNTIKTKSTTALLNPVIWVGTGLIVLAGVGFIFTRNLYACGILAAVGGGLVVGAFLLAQYAAIVMGVGIVSALGVGIYLLYRYHVAHVAAVDNTKLINVIKEKLPDETYEDVFYGKNGAAPLVSDIQNPSTRKFVDKVKQKIKYGKKA